MKSGSMVLMAIAIALVFLTPIFLFAAIPPSERVIMTSADLPYKGWVQVIYARPQIPFFPNDSFESAFQNNATTPNGTVPQAGIVVDVYHFDSVSDAHEAFLLANQSNLNSPYRYQIVPVGDEGFMVTNSYSNYSEGQVFFAKGSFMVWMDFSWVHGFAWSDENSLKVAQVQADKIS